MRRKVNEAKLIIEEKMRQVKVNAERSDKAEWAISLCNCRVTFELIRKQEVRFFSVFKKAFLFYWFDTD